MVTHGIRLLRKSDGGEKTANYNTLLLLETKLKETHFMYITDGKNYLNASKTEYFFK